MSYDEADVRALMAEPRFIIAVDAYGANRCTLAQMTRLAFTEPPYVPRDLHPITFAQLVLELVRRIKSREIKIDHSAKDTFIHFYNQQEPEEAW